MVSLVLIQLKDAKPDVLQMNTQTLSFVFVFKIAQFALIIIRQAMENAFLNVQQ
jgi:hypothetical protein